MTKKDQVRGSHRINDSMLDEMLEGTDAAAMVHSGELLLELLQRLAERISGCGDGAASGSVSGRRARQHSQRAQPQDGADGRWVDAAGSAAGSTGNV